MRKFIRTAVDLGKNYFQVHALESEGGRSISRKVKRSKMHEVFSTLRVFSISAQFHHNLQIFL